MSLPAEPAARHRAVAAAFTSRIEGATDWDAPAPVPGWRARDVVGHLVDWFPGFLESATGIALERGPSVAGGPGHRRGGCTPTPCSGCSTARTRRRRSGTRWSGRCRCRSPSTASTRPTSSCTPGTSPAPPGRTSALDADTCADLLAGMTPIEDLLRSSGQYGPAVPVPPDADAQTRLLGFIGRDPGWTAVSR